MKKIILFLLLIPFLSFGQTANGTETKANAFRALSPQTVTSPNFLTTTGTDGTQGKVLPANLPVSTATQTAIDAKVGDFINDGATTIAPSMNAVYDALVKKLDRTSTTVISGLDFVNNGTTFNISAGVYQIVDNSTVPYTVQNITFAGQSNITPLYGRTIVYLNNLGQVVQLNGATGDLTPLQRRENLFVAIFAFDGVNILAPQFTPSIDYDVSGRLFDLSETLGARNRDGNIIAANGANLQLNKGAGHTYRIGSNYATNKKSPDVTEDVAIIPIPASPNLIAYRNGSGGWTYESFTGSLTPTFWDNGTGIKATVTNNRFTIPRLYFFNGTNTFVLYLGQTEYNSLDAAKGAIYTETRAVDPATSLATHRASIPIEKGTTSLSTQPTLFYIENHIDSKSLSGTGGSGGAQNMQSGYDNSVTPQITTTTGLGAVALKRGSAADTDNVLVVQNGAGSDTFTVKGNGNTGIFGLLSGVNASFSSSITATQFVKSGGLSTEYLKADGSVSTLTNPITGTLTSSYIPKATGANSLGNSLIYDSGTNVGIGTNTPSAILHSLKSGTPISAVGDETFIGQRSASTDNSAIAIISNSESILRFSNTSTAELGAIKYNVISNYLSFTTSSNEAGRFTTSGNLLLNTTTDDGVNKLQVNGSVAASTYTGGATLTGTPTAPTAAAGTNTTQIATTAFVQNVVRPYKVYTALLTQSGTGAPGVTVLENTLGGSIVWTRNINGEYYGTLSSAFVANKTYHNISNTNYTHTFTTSRISPSVIVVLTATIAGTPVDSILTETPIEIRVYN